MVIRYSVVRYRCECCSKIFETQHDAIEHEKICRESRFVTPSLMGQWVESSDGLVGMAAQTRNSDSMIGVITPFSSMPSWIPPQRLKVIDAGTARSRLGTALEAKLHAFELKADDYRDGAL